MSRWIFVVALMLTLASGVAADGGRSSEASTSTHESGSSDGDSDTTTSHPRDEAEPRHPPHDEPGPEPEPEPAPEPDEGSDRPSYCKFYEFTGDFPRPSVSVNPVLGWIMIYPTDCLDRPTSIYFPGREMIGPLPPL